MDRKRGVNILFVFVAGFGILILHDLLVRATTVERITYSQFEQSLEEGKIAEVAVGADRLTGRYKAGPDGKPGQRFTTVRVDNDIAAKLGEHGVAFEGAVESTFLRDVLSWVLPALFFIAIWLFVLRRVLARGGMGGTLMSVGKSKAKIYVEQDVKVGFADVAGVDEAEGELVEIVEFLKDPARYGRLGGRLPKGVLLVGPPGTGKTLLARAVAGEAGVPFLSISGSEFVEMFVGVGAARVRDLFEQARSKAPCIIFIDELDALGRARGMGPFSGGHDEKEQTLNQLLVEMDGFDPSEGVILMGATNRPEILDPALLRAGRFDRQILVDRPDRRGREEILALHLKKVQVAPDVDVAAIAAITPGFSGADLANLINEAALLATRAGKNQVEAVDFTMAVERLIAGLEKKNRVLNEKERRIVAYHELGHAIVASSIPGCDPVHKVSIIPRGIGALGYTMQRPLEDRYLMTRQELLNKMSVLLGGRAAEQLVFGEISTGAADDLDRATEIARSMVARYGMAPRLGLATYDRERHPQLGDLAARQNFGEATADAIDEEVRTLLDDAFRRSSAILEDRRAALVRTAAVLLEKETLGGDELKQLLTEEPAPVAAGRP